MSALLENAALLLFALAIVLLTVRRGRAGYLTLAAADAAGRRVLYRRMILGQLLLFAGPALLSLWVLGRWDALRAVPAPFWGVMTTLGVSPPRGEPWLIAFYLGCGALGVIIGVGVDLWQLRGGRVPKARTLGEFAAMVPQTREERVYGAGVACAAGICEELFFRLMLPLLLTGIGASPWLALALSTLLFGLVHRYQKWLGVVATTAAGALFAAIYLMSGSLLLAMLIHILINLNALVLRPVLQGIGALRTSASTPS